MAAPKNVLYYGDNLDVLRQHIKDESVDLVYLDPPFNSNASYNVLFAEHGTQSAAQIMAFEDTWRWDEAAAYDYQQTVEHGGRVADTLRGLRTVLGTSDMLAYLSMMAPRLKELWRVMKPTASIYLHCDPTASHYLKLLMDAVFGPTNFEAEIIWKRTSAHNDPQRPGRIHDTLLFFAKTPDFTWNRIYQEFDPAYVEQYYRYHDPDGRRFMSGDFTANHQGPRRSFGDKGTLAPPPGRQWAYNQEGIDRLLSENRVFFTRNGIPRRKIYLDESPGMPLQDVWTDIQALRSWHAERLGYPTQKPVALLERIVSASTNTGDTVLDPFCGCGTTVAAAQALDRRWIGIDITHLAIGLIKHRLTDVYGPSITAAYHVIGEPADLDGARQLASDDPFQFQAWALGLVGARVTGSEKKGGDKGIDGRLYFHDEGAGGRSKQILFSVKAGMTGGNVTHRRAPRSKQQADQLSL